MNGFVAHSRRSVHVISFFSPYTRKYVLGTFYTTIKWILRIYEKKPSEKLLLYHDVFNLNEKVGFKIG